MFEAKHHTSLFYFCQPKKKEQTLCIKTLKCLCLGAATEGAALHRLPSQKFCTIIGVVSILQKVQPKLGIKSPVLVLRWRQNKSTSLCLWFWTPLQRCWWDTNGWGNKFRRSSSSSSSTFHRGAHSGLFQLDFYHPLLTLCPAELDVVSVTRVWRVMERVCNMINTLKIAVLVIGLKLG